MKKILCFGNPHIKEDSLALKLADKLTRTVNKPEFEFIKCTNPEEITDIDQDHLIILDVAKGIKETTLIRDIDQLTHRTGFNMTSMHDFDLGFYLKLMKSLNKIKNILIIGIPYNYQLDKAEQELIKILKKI